MRWENLTLSKKEQVGYVLPEDHRKGEFIIAAKFLTSRFLQMEVMARMFKQLWRTNRGFRIRNQGNKYCFVCLGEFGGSRQNTEKSTLEF